MKRKITMLPLFFFFLALTLQAQKPEYPTPNGKEQVSFGQKPSLPTLNDIDGSIPQTNEKKMKNLPYTTFDTVAKKFIMHTQDLNMTQYFTSKSTGTSSTKLIANNAKVVPSSFHLTKDINTATAPSYPSNFPANLQSSFSVLRNISYFSADDGINGRELWRSDGTPIGTYMVKDINPGQAGSDVSGIIAANGLLYFSAVTNDNGYEPWVSDGTESGTHLLIDLSIGGGGSNPNQFTNVNGIIFFSATSLYGSYNGQIWKTDGTAGGTNLVKDLQQSSIGYSIYELTAVNDMAYFVAYTWSAGYQLFRSDGTDAGTYVVKQIGYYQYDQMSAPMQLTTYNNNLYFSVNDGTGRRLWTSDGTAGGTGYAISYNDVFMQSDNLSIYNNTPFPILNNVLFIAGFTYADGSGLYKYDAANADGIVLVKDLTTTYDFEVIVPVEMSVVNDAIYFKVVSSTNAWHDELWSTKGDGGNTQAIKVFLPGEQTYNYYNGLSSLYFVKYDAIYGNELWKSNGTDLGTSLVSDIFPGKGASYPYDLTFYNNKLLFSATGINNGSELWISDGTGAGTSIVKDINYAQTSGSDAGYMFKGLCSTGNGVLFNAFTPALGGELYKSDGTTAGTVLLNDITPGSGWSYPNSIIFKNNLGYFIADNAVNTGIYTTNNTTEGLHLITYIDRSIFYVVNFTVTDNGLVFYTLSNRFTGADELWRSDGTEAGTYLLTPGLSYYYNNSLIAIGNTVFFVAGDFATGYELWKSDGTIASTKIVKDINVGYSGSNPYSLFAYKKDLYFGAWDGGLNYSLWKSDGSEKGTIKLKSITPANYFARLNPEPQHVFCVSNSTLYFNATDFNTYGAELWKTNGTQAGTKLVKDINPSGYSNPGNLTDVNNTLFFTADDGLHGIELWSTTGTSGGTNLVRDIAAPFDNSTYNNLCSAGGKLYFLKHVYSYYPVYSESISFWSSDGTAQNTIPVADAGLTGLSNFSQLTPAGNKLFFGAYSPQHGTELYEGDAGSTAFTAARVSVPVIDEVKTFTNFEVLLYPNPVHNTAALQITGEAKSITISIYDATGKLIWLSSFSNPSKINLPTEKLTAGIYSLTINNGKENKNIKLVKE